MKVIHWSLALLLAISVGCAKNKTSDTVDSAAVADAAEESDFVTEVEEGTSAPVVAETPMTASTDTTEAIAPTDQVATTQPDPELKLEKNEMVQVGSVEVSTEIGDYEVENGETLMLVAFKIYGDYGKWKSLKELNPKMTNQRLAKGTRIRYYVPKEKFVWNPSGNPYLIKMGDSLGTISKEKYGSNKRWKDIFNNNRPMIKDPNLIFAGFTLYYIPDKRNMASE